MNRGKVGTHHRDVDSQFVLILADLSEWDVVVSLIDFVRVPRRHLKGLPGCFPGNYEIFLDNQCFLSFEK